MISTMSFFWLLFILIVLLVVFYILFKFLIVGTEKEWKFKQYYFNDPNSGDELKFPSINELPSLYMSIIVPAYNEEDRISIMLDETIQYCEDRQKKDESFTWEIIVVDDGSKDKTKEVVRKYVEQCATNATTNNSNSSSGGSSSYDNTVPLRLLPLLPNRGKGGAVREGMMVGRGKYLLMVDADGATKFSDIERLEAKLKQVEKNGHGIVAGSRAHLQQTEAVAKRAWYRNITMHVFHFLVEYLCGVNSIKDTQCGFKLFTRKTASYVFTNLHIERWAFDVELLYLASVAKIPVAEVAVTWEEIDGSHLSLFGSSIQMSRDLVRIRLLYFFNFWQYSSAKQ